MDQHGSAENDPRISWPQDHETEKISSNSSSSRQKFKAILSPNQKQKKPKNVLKKERAAHTYIHMAIGLIVPLMIIAKTKTKARQPRKELNSEKAK